LKSSKKWREKKKLSNSFSYEENIIRHSDIRLYLILKEEGREAIILKKNISQANVMTAVSFSKIYFHTTRGLEYSVPG